MLSDFLSFCDRGLNCIENCYVNIVKAYRQKYYMLFSHFFGLQLVRQGELFHFYIEGITPELVEEVFQIQSYQEFNLRSSLQLIRQDLKKNYFVMAELYSPYCRWIPKEYVMYHSFFIVGSTENGFYCMDIYNNYKNFLSIENFIKGFRQTTHFRVKKEIKIDELTFIKDYISQVDLKTVFEKINSGLSDNSMYSLSNLISLQRDLTVVSGKRSLYAAMLSSIKGERHILDALDKASTWMQNISYLWTTLRNIMIRSQLESDHTYYRKTILKKIFKIEKEELLLQKFILNI